MDSKYTEHINKYNSVLEEKPNDPYSLAILARIAVKENRLEDAENYYNFILLNDPAYPEALYMMGIFHMRRNQAFIAMDYFKQLISNGVETSFIYEYMAMMDSKNRKEYLSKALEVSKQYTIRHKDYRRCAYIAFQSYAWGEYDIALEYANLAYTAKPTGDIINLLGCIYYYNGEYDIALEYANLAYTAKPTDDIINLLGCIYHYNGDYDKALSFFHEVSANYESRNTYVLCNIASCYKNKNSHKMAIRYLEKALDVEPANKFVYYSMGSIYMITGNKKLAAEMFEHALEIDEDYKEAKRALEAISE